MSIVAASPHFATAAASVESLSVPGRLHHAVFGSMLTFSWCLKRLRRLAFNSSARLARACAPVSAPPVCPRSSRWLAGEIWSLTTFTPGGPVAGLQLQGVYVWRASKARLNLEGGSCRCGRSFGGCMRTTADQTEQPPTRSPHPSRPHCILHPLRAQRTSPSHRPAQ